MKLIEPDSQGTEQVRFLARIDAREKQMRDNRHLWPAHHQEAYRNEFNTERDRLFPSLAEDKIRKAVDSLRTLVFHNAFTKQQRENTLAWLATQPAIEILESQLKKARQIVTSHRAAHNLPPVEMITRS